MEALCSVTSQPAQQPHSVQSASAATRRGSALQPHSFSSSLCCAEGRRAQPHKSLHYGSGTRALLHYGFHIRAFIRALSHSNELCSSAEPLTRSAPGPRITAPTRLPAAPNAEERSMRIVIFFFIPVIVKL